MALMEHRPFNHQPDLPYSLRMQVLKGYLKKPRREYSLRTFIEASLIAEELDHQTADISRPIENKADSRALRQWEGVLYRNLLVQRAEFEQIVGLCPPEKLEEFTARLAEYQQLQTILTEAEEAQDPGAIARCQEAIAEFEAENFDTE